MKKLLFLLILIANSMSFAALNGPWDFQVWVWTLAASNITEKSKFTIFSEYRFGNDASEFFYNQTCLQYLYQVTPWLQIEPTYRQIYHKNNSKSQTEWFPEYNPLFFAFTLFQTFNGFVVSDRNWTFLRMFPTNIRKNEWQYRNRLQVVTPWSFSPLNIVPYFSDEVFFQERIGFLENRLLFGLGTPFNDTVDLLISYMLRTQKTKGEGLHNENVVIFDLVIGF